MQCLIWQMDGMRAHPSPLENPQWIGQSLANAHRRPALLAPIVPREGVVAVLIVTETKLARVTRNGAKLGTGLHALRHADEVCVGDSQFWISVQPSIEITTYDPAKHGVDIFCFITKARLHSGLEIAICPGTPKQACGIIYKREAWDLAQQQSASCRCANCGFENKQAAWQPPVAQQHSNLEKLLLLANPQRSQKHV